MPDYLHPNAEGHLLIFQTIESDISKLMINFSSNLIISSFYIHQKFEHNYEKQISPPSFIS